MLTDRCLGDALFGSLPVVGISGCDGVGRVEPCSAGCMLMGPVNGDLRRGIIDNAPQTTLFGYRPAVRSTSPPPNPAG
jgi:hypothetical protein